jgi:(E)-4-hydroxy-3-methylbut-2-enyl-diphosphate synthase
VISACQDRGIPIRIGVNAGSLGKELLRKYPEPNADALVESALRNVDILDRHDFQDFKVSVKASEVFMAVEAYRKLAEQIEQPLHLGITEAGGTRGGTVKSAVGLGMLLMEGNRRHHTHFPRCGSGGRDQGGLRDSQKPEIAGQWHQFHRLSELLATEL